MVYIKNTTDISIAEEKVSEIMTQLKIGVDYDDIRIIASVSIGISIIDEKTGSYSEAYRQTDNAMYEAKGKGKNKYEIYRVSDKSFAR